ncbi:MAG: hypothetical protein V1770_04855 [bacterium]
MEKFYKKTLGSAVIKDVNGETILDGIGPIHVPQIILFFCSDFVGKAILRLFCSSSLKGCYVEVNKKEDDQILLKLKDKNYYITEVMLGNRWMYHSKIFGINNDDRGYSSTNSTGIIKIIEFFSQKAGKILDIYVSDQNNHKGSLRLKWCGNKVIVKHIESDGELVNYRLFSLFDL